MFPVAKVNPLYSNQNTAIDIEQDIDPSGTSYSKLSCPCCHEYFEFPDAEARALVYETPVQGREPSTSSMQNLYDAPADTQAPIYDVGTTADTLYDTATLPPKVQDTPLYDLGQNPDDLYAVITRKEPTIIQETALYDLGENPDSDLYAVLPNKKTQRSRLRSR